MLGGPLLPRAVLPHSTPYGPLRLRSGLKAYPGLLSFALFRAKYRDGMHGIPYVVEISLRQRLGRWPRGKTTERNIPSAARRFAQDKLNVQPRRAPPRYRDFALLKISLRSTSNPGARPRGIGISRCSRFRFAQHPFGKVPTTTLRASRINSLRMMNWSAFGGPRRVGTSPEGSGLRFAQQWTGG